MPALIPLRRRWRHARPASRSSNLAHSDTTPPALEYPFWRRCAAATVGHHGRGLVPGLDVRSGGLGSVRPELLRKAGDYLEPSHSGTA
jgi:hypothetical protein